MIGTVDCNVQAKYPSMPLDPMQAYVGSPSSIRVRNVPKRIGDWCIRSVQFVAVYPDASIKTAECKLVGGVWVGTIEGTQTSGRSEKGYSIFASGTDENGDEVNGYCLGKGDIEIFEADGTINPGTTSYYMHLLSAESESPKAGDVWLSGDAINIVDTDGTTKTFEQPELSGYATKDELSAKQDKISANGILSGDGQGNITSADMEGVISSTVLARDDVWTVTGFSGWTYQYQVQEQWGSYAGQEGWIYTVNVTSCDNPEWRYTSEASEPIVSPTKLETFTTTLQDWGEYEYPIDTYTVTASVERDRNELGLVTYDDIIVGILSGDGQGNITSADMSMYVKRNDSPMFNGLTSFGSNSIEGYATTAQLEDGLSGKADLSSLSDYYTKTEVDTALSGKADKYPFTAISDDSGTINLRDAEVQKYTAAAQQALSVYPPSGTSTTARDLVFVLDCAANNVSVNVQWANNIHPRTDASTDLSVLSNAVNVYYLSEYASGQFVIAGWQETAGGNT